jgi:L-fucose isomerase-like protein
VSLALDFDEVSRQLRLLSVKKQLASARMLTLGAYWCADKLPEPEQVKHRLGVELVPVSAADFLAEVERVEPVAAQSLAKSWLEASTGPAEPNAAELLGGARIYLALAETLRSRGARAASVGCLELMYTRSQAPFCFALASLRDIGLPAGCEADAGATLTMLMLDLLTQQPAYMGNLVRAEPETGIVHISHGCSPARMHGRDRPAKSYRLVHSHSVPPFSRDLTGGAGVTSYVDYGDVGQVVTFARLGADVAHLFAATGEIVACRDTICDRTTLSVRVRDARSFVQKATGNHQVVIYGDWLDDLRALARLLDLRLVEP